MNFARSRASRILIVLFILDQLAALEFRPRGSPGVFPAALRNERPKSSVDNRALASPAR